MLNWRCLERFPSVAGTEDDQPPTATGSVSVRCPGMTKKLALLAVIPLVALSVRAQEPLQQQPYPGSVSGQTGTPDCTDPLMASAPECSGQYTGVNPYSSGVSGMMMPRTMIPGQSQNLNYMDYGPPGRGLGYYQPQRPLPPEPLTEFQKFVASTTGEVLPIFGANLFRYVPSTFAPLDLTPVPPDYAIGPGDELRIRVWGQVNFHADVRVDRSGEIYLPQVGEVHVAGIPFSGLDEHLRSAVGRVFHNFDLTADVGEIRAIQVYLTGEARRPGVYTVSSLSTLVDALFAGGGPSATGSLRKIELRRSGKVVATFDLYDLLIHGDKSKDVPLQSGDVIFIPAAGPEVAVTGSIRNPAVYELRPGESLGSLIAGAGGATAIAARTQISIERIDEHRNRLAMEVAYDKQGLTTTLDDGDLVLLYSILPQYQKTVTLRGNTANPGRFAWHPGMKVSELIPDRDSLITRNYWWRRAQLGLPGPEFEPLRYFPNLRQPTYPANLPRSQLLGHPPLPRPGMAGNQIGQGGAAGQQNSLGLAGSNQSTVDQYATDQYGTGATPTDQYGNPTDQYGNAAAGYSTDQGYAGQNYDTTGVPPDQTATGGPTGSTQGVGGQRAPSASSASLAEEQSELGPRVLSPTRTRVGPIAPDIDWNYAVIERLDPKTLKTTLIPFDLGRLVLHHDESQNLTLEPGDVVSILSQADIRVPVNEQTKFVRLEGEFVHSGIYTVRPGETLRELVKRAGGFSPNAYLYGSEFTRESTRTAQQRRLNEYIETLSLQIQQGNLAIISSPVSSPQDLATGSAAQASEQAMLTQLSRMRATGRIVLEFRPGTTAVDSLPDIALEDGDRFMVPTLPASVNVVGAVYDQNSFLYTSSRRAGSYLRLAGGPNRDADAKHIFVIRADGSVISREAESGIWGNEFAGLRMNPGDTIVVPQKIFKPSAMRGFLEYSQLFSQFAFGAAALSFIY